MLPDLPDLPLLPRFLALSFFYNGRFTTSACIRRVNAQEAPLPAAPTPPPDVQEREKLGKPPTPPGRSPEVDELLQKLRLTRADIERRKAEKAERELPATADEPPDVKERKNIEKPPAPPARSPNLDELLEKIREATWWG